MPPVFEVLLTTPAGDAVLEVPTFLGAEAAGRRALWSAVALGWGEPDQVTVAAVTELVRS
jgi:hypothetical protein